MIEAQCLQAGSHAGPQPRRRRVADQPGPVLAQAFLGGDHDAVPVASQVGGQRPTEQAFGAAEPVTLGRVEEVDSLPTRLLDGGEGCSLVDRAPFTPELPGAVSDWGDSSLEAARITVLI